MYPSKRYQPTRMHLERCLRHPELVKAEALSIVVITAIVFKKRNLGTARVMVCLDVNHGERRLDLYCPMADRETRAEECANYLRACLSKDPRYVEHPGEVAHG